MFRKAKVRTVAGSTALSRNPAIVIAPGDPASTQVVTPVREATGSGRMPQ